MSFNYFLADDGAIADGLNPLNISHIAITISCTAIGRAKVTSSKIGDIPENTSKIISTTPTIKRAAAKKPQTDRKLGINLVRYIMKYNIMAPTGNRKETEIMNAQLFIDCMPFTNIE